MCYANIFAGNFRYPCPTGIDDIHSTASGTMFVFHVLCQGGRNGFSGGAGGGAGSRGSNGARGGSSMRRVIIVGNEQ